MLTDIFVKRKILNEEEGMKKKQVKKKVVLDVWALDWRSCVGDIKYGLKSTAGVANDCIELFKTKQGVLDSYSKCRPKPIPRHLKITIEEL